MYKLFLLYLAFLFSSPVIAGNVCDDAKIKLQQAVTTYKSEDGATFIKQLLKNGPLENDSNIMDRAQILKQIEQFLGQINSVSILSAKSLGTKSCYILSILEYDKGPAFAAVSFYNGSKGIAATSMSFNTEPEQMFPIEFLVQ
jgi:hypothetical protein